MISREVGSIRGLGVGVESLGFKGLSTCLNPKKQRAFRLPDMFP